MQSCGGDSGLLDLIGFGGSPDNSKKSTVSSEERKKRRQSHRFSTPTRHRSLSVPRSSTLARSSAGELIKLTAVAPDDTISSSSTTKLSSSDDSSLDASIYGGREKGGGCRASVVDLTKSIFSRDFVERSREEEKKPEQSSSSEKKIRKLKEENDKLRSRMDRLAAETAAEENETHRVSFLPDLGGNGKLALATVESCRTLPIHNVVNVADGAPIETADAVVLDSAAAESKNPKQPKDLAKKKQFPKLKVTTAAKNVADEPKEEEEEEVCSPSDLQERLKEAEARIRSLEEEIIVAKDSVARQRVTTEDIATIQKHVQTVLKRNHQLEQKLKTIKAAAVGQKSSNKALKLKIEELLEQQAQNTEMENGLVAWKLDQICRETATSSEALGFRHQINELKCEVAVERIAKRRFEAEAQDLFQALHGSHSDGSDVSSLSPCIDLRERVLMEEEQKVEVLRAEQSSLRKDHEAVVAGFQRNLHEATEQYQREQSALKAKVKVLEGQLREKKELWTAHVCSLQDGSLDARNGLESFVHDDPGRHVSFEDEAPQQGMSSAAIDDSVPPCADLDTDPKMPQQDKDVGEVDPEVRHAEEGIEEPLETPGIIPATTEVVEADEDPTKEEEIESCSQAMEEGAKEGQEVIGEVDSSVSMEEASPAPSSEGPKKEPREANESDDKQSCSEDFEAREIDRTEDLLIENVVPDVEAASTASHVDGEAELVDKEVPPEKQDPDTELSAEKQPPNSDADLSLEQQATKPTAEEQQEPKPDEAISLEQREPGTKPPTEKQQPSAVSALVAKFETKRRRGARDKEEARLELTTTDISEPLETDTATEGDGDGVAQWRDMWGSNDSDEATGKLSGAEQSNDTFLEELGEPDNNYEDGWIEDAISSVQIGLTARSWQPWTWHES